MEEHGIPVYNPSDHTILIVDDDETNVHVLESLLSGEGYRTMSALSGFQALELFAQAMPKPSCVLLDIGLPDISGASVACNHDGGHVDLVTLQWLGFVLPQCTRVNVGLVRAQS